MFFYTSLESALFASEPVRFALTHRLGGVSKGAFSTLNLGYHVGDAAHDVAQNHALIAHRFYNCFNVQSIEAPIVHYCNQIHSTHSLILKDAFASQNISGASVCLGEADGIITHTPHKLALIMVADCNPILLYDRIHRALALIHAGRKGVFGNILQATLEHLHTHFATRAQDILMYVGASIRACCYEVGKEIQNEALALFGRDVLQRNKLDLIMCLTMQARALGIMDNHIEISPHCSCCEPLLYSYRKERITGRFGLLAMIES